MLRGAKHKYIFYYFPKPPGLHGTFAFYTRVSEGKERAIRFGLSYDYQKIY